jgi:hypothetical protein
VMDVKFDALILRVKSLEWVTLVDCIARIFLDMTRGGGCSV